jgi:uncharacterized membrane protein
MGRRGAGDGAGQREGDGEGHVLGQRRHGHESVYRTRLAGQYGGDESVVNAMRSRGLLYFPLHAGAIGMLTAAVLVLLLLIEMNAIRFAYERMGLSPAFALGFLVLCLIMSHVNVPVYSFNGEHVSAGPTVESFGLAWNVPPVTDRSRTVLAVNLGGAVAPALLAFYLMVSKGIVWESVVASALVASIVHVAARPVQGLGIAVPTFVPPVVAVATAVALASPATAALALIAGTLGTLIGADLTNLHKIRGLGAPVASIGGAGTFDGIFVTGVLAVLLA